MTFDRCRYWDYPSVRIVLTGVVGPAAVGGVEDAVRNGLRSGPRVQVDLRNVERWEGDALGGVAECARLGNGVEFLMAGKGRVPGAPA